MAICRECKEKVKLGDVFCSTKCKENHYESIKIVVPDIYVRRLFQFYPKNLIPVQIRKFSRRHGYRPDLVRKEIFSIANTYGYKAS
jgi:hypothetical protein